MKWKQLSLIENHGCKGRHCNDVSEIKRTIKEYSEQPYIATMLPVPEKWINNYHIFLTKTQSEEIENRNIPIKSNETESLISIL